MVLQKIVYAFSIVAYFKLHCMTPDTCFLQWSSTSQGRIQDFKLEGCTLKICAEQREARKFLGYFVWKKHDFTPKNHFFFQFWGGGPPGAPPPPPGSAPASIQISILICANYNCVFTPYSSDDSVFFPLQPITNLAPQRTVICLIQWVQPLTTVRKRSGVHNIA